MKISFFSHRNKIDFFLIIIAVNARAEFLKMFYNFIVIQMSREINEIGLVPFLPFLGGVSSKCQDVINGVGVMNSGILIAIRKKGILSIYITFYF